MVNSKDRFEADLKRLARAQETLVEALKQPKNSFIRDAVVKRFEYTFEISWKTVKAACDYLGFDCKSPREAIRTAFKQGWIKETEGWFEMLDARNLTSHTYEEERGLPCIG